MTTLVKKATQLTLAVLVLLAVCVPMFSQAAVGTILGGIFDTSGGRISGAQVTITDVARGTTRVLTTNSTGEYTAPSLLAGTYTVRAEFQGFEATEHSNIVLGVAQDVRVDLTMSPGAQTQTVTVTQEVPAIDTTSATLGGTVTNTAIVTLPLVTRNFLGLLALRPGIVEVPGGDGSSTTTNGRRVGTDVLVIEGVTQFDLATSNVLINGANKGGGADQLPLDSLQEFTTQQSAPAEYGWRDGSAINVGIKSGTNSIHGSAYAFGRNAPWTDARQYNNLVPGALGNLQAVQPGFTLGGPAIKNKLFWFVSAEFSRKSSYSTASVATPTDVPGLGIASSMVDACNALGRNNVNPLSAQIAGLPPGSCTPLPGTSTFENLFPYNTTGSISIFPFNATNAPSNNGLAKVDYNPNDKNHISGFVYISKQTTVAIGNLQPGGLASPYWGTDGIGSTQEYAGSWTYSPNSSWVNDLRGGAAPNLGNSVNGDVNLVSPNPYGSGGYSVNSGVTNPAYGGFMCLAIKGISGSATSGIGNCGRNGARGPQYQLDFSDKVSHQWGNHAIKFGYEEVFVHFEDSTTNTLPGLVAFNTLTNFLQGKTLSGKIITGDITDNFRERWHAAFVQDTWRISKRVTLTPGLRWEYIGSPHSTVNHLGAFDPTVPGGVEQVGPGLPDSTVIHPDKKNFNPRMGVAWDISGKGRTILRAGVGNLSSFPSILSVTGLTIPYGATLCAGPSTTTASGVTACANPANIVINRYGTPQQGFAGLTSTFGAGGLDANWTTSCTNATMTATCNGPSIFPTSSALTATSGPTCATGKAQCSMQVTDPNFKNPKSIQWNLDIQRALTNSLTLDVAYVGVHGYDEVHTVDLNEPAFGTGWDASAINTCLGAANVATAANGWINNKCAPDAAAITAARPYNTAFPYYGYILQTTNGFHSNYNGLQVTLDGRNFHGLHFLTSYTYGHAQDDWTKSSAATTALADPSNLHYQYGNSDMDVRHRLRFSPTYDIPGIKSPGQMLQGWQISGIWAWQTGFAWAPTDQGTNDFGGTGEISNGISSPNNGVWQTWNYTGPKGAFNGNGFNPIPCYGQASNCTPLAQAPAQILQSCMTAAQAPYSTATQQMLAVQALASSSGACYVQNGGILTPPAWGTLGNAGRGAFEGPHYQDWDISLSKMWHVKERYSALFRIECYNCFNEVNPAQFTDGGAGGGNGDPSAGGGVIAAALGKAGFGYHIPPTQNMARQFQFGLKLTF